jgi:predicted ester cyclase
MSAQQVRQTMQEYVDTLRARGDYRRFFAEDIEFEIMGTEQRGRGAAAAMEAIRFMHEVAFDAHPELVGVLVDEHGAALEVVFLGRHVGEFAGIAPTGTDVRLPYSVFYDVTDGLITGLRIYMSIERLVAQIATPRHADAVPSA